MKVLVKGFCIALTCSFCIMNAQEETITIKSVNGKEFTVPRSVLNAPVLLAWFAQENVKRTDMKGLISAETERKLIEQEQREKKVITFKNNARAHYLQTGEGRSIINRYPDISFSINDLLENGILKTVTASKKMNIGKNSIRINTLSITNQLISDIKGLDSINNINQFGYIDLSNNRIKSLDIETLKSIHSTLRFPMTFNVANNQIRLTKELRQELAKLPMISVLT